MKVNLSRPFFRTLALVLASLWPVVASAGPDTVVVTTTDVRTRTVVPLHRKLADKVLIACGVGEPLPVYVPPGYLELTGPAPMMVYRRPAPLHPRRVAVPAERDEKPDATPAASPSPSPAANGAPSTAPLVPLPVPLPAAPEPGLLPEPGAGNPAGQNPTEEMLSYFQRQRPVPRANDQGLQGSGGQGQNDAAAEPSFLQPSLAPEQPVLPPSRATYRVTP